jgi:hypothetical protein
MKRLTIAMSEDLYARLLGYAADQSKSQLRRLSLGETVRTLISARLDELGYAMIHEEIARVENQGITHPTASRTRE